MSIDSWGHSHGICTVSLFLCLSYLAGKLTFILPLCLVLGCSFLPWSYSFRVHISFSDQTSTCKVEWCIQFHCCRNFVAIVQVRRRFFNEFLLCDIMWNLVLDNAIFCIFATLFCVVWIFFFMNFNFYRLNHLTHCDGQKYSYMSKQLKWSV